MNKPRIVIHEDNSIVFEDPTEKNFSILGISRVVNSGNPNYDPSSGQFASGGNKKKPAPKQAAAKSPKQDKEFKFALAKRQDAVRYVARRFINPTPEDIISSTKSATTRELTPLEIQEIIKAARIHQLNDIVDIIDGLIKKQGLRALSQDNAAIIKASKGWVKSVLSSMSNDEIYDAYRRLIARGCTEEEINKEFFKRFSKDKQIEIKDMLGESNDTNSDTGEKT